MEFDFTIRVVVPGEVLRLLERIADALEGAKVPAAEEAPARRAIEPLAPVVVPADSAWQRDDAPAVIPPPAPAEAPARKPKRNMSAEGLANIRAASARRWARARGEAGSTRPAVPPELATRDGSISTARLEEAAADQGGEVAMAWDDVLEWGRRWAPKVIEAGGTEGVLLAAINRRRAEEKLPPFRVAANMFATRGALPSAGIG